MLDDTDKWLEMQETAARVSRKLKGIHAQSRSPRSRVLLEKLTVTQLVKKFPAFYGTRRFITVFTRSSHWSLS
jgi:hypothetical protein